MERRGRAPAPGKVERGQRTKGAADKVERLAALASRPVGRRQSLPHRRRQLAPLVGSQRPHPQHAERQGNARPRLPVRDPHQFQAAAAQIRHDPVRIGQAGDHAERRHARLVRTAQHLEAMAERADGVGEQRAIPSVAHRRRRHDARAVDSGGLGQRHEAGDGGERGGRGAPRPSARSRRPPAPARPSPFR